MAWIKCKFVCYNNFIEKESIINMDKIDFNRSEWLDKCIIGWLNGRYSYADRNNLQFHLIRTIEIAKWDYIIELHLTKLNYCGYNLKTNQEKIFFFDRLIDSIFQEYQKKIKSFGNYIHLIYFYSLMSKITELNVCFQFLLQKKKEVLKTSEIIRLIENIVFPQDVYNVDNSNEIENFLSMVKKTISIMLVQCSANENTGNKIINENEIQDAFEYGMALVYINELKYSFTNGAYKKCNVCITENGEINFKGIPEKILYQSDFNDRVDIPSIEYTQDIIEDIQRSFSDKNGYSLDDMKKSMESFDDLEANKVYIGSKEEWIDLLGKRKIKKMNAEKLFNDLTFDNIKNKNVFTEICNGNISVDDKALYKYDKKYILSSFYAEYVIQYRINTLFDRPSTYLNKGIEKKINDSFNLEIAKKIKHDIPDVYIATEIKLSDIISGVHEQEFDMIILLNSKIYIVETKRWGFWINNNEDKNLRSNIVKTFDRQMTKEKELFIKYQDQIMEYLIREKEFEFDKLRKYDIEVSLITKEKVPFIESSNGFNKYRYDEFIKYLVKKKSKNQIKIKYKIGILYICTGKYDVFWKEFYENMEKYFLHNSEKHYFVFTDAEYLYGEECNRIHKIYQECMGWPYDTLMRFDLFTKVEAEIKEYDYIFFMNANMLCMKEITEDEFLPVEENLLVARHPGCIHYPKWLFPYERNKKSTAYIPYGQGKYYYMGGLNGGKAQAYLELIHSLKQAIQEDLARGVIAKWHDESQLNKYMLNRNDAKILLPEYAYPEGWNLPYEAKIIIRDKDKYMNTSSMKGYKSWWVNVKKKIRRKLPV